MTLHGLIAADALPADLFDDVNAEVRPSQASGLFVEDVSGDALRVPDVFPKTAPARTPDNRAKAESMSRALDKINTRFGRDSVLLGMLPSQGKSFAGTKVAFTRIPDRAEFTE